MNIAIIAIGSRGDVQPLSALGKGLQAGGHTVTLVTHDLFETFVQELGLAFYPLRGLALQEFVTKGTGQAAERGGKERLSAYIQAFQLLKSAIPAIGDCCWNACQTADLIIYNLLVPGVPGSVAERLEIPQVVASIQPLEPTADFPNPFVLRQSCGRLFNRLTHYVGPVLIWPLMRSTVNTWRAQRLGLQPLDRMHFVRGIQRPILRLYGISSHVVPRPADWSEHAFVTGYWFLEQTDHWQPSASLVDFLESGTPPVAVGFGSMVAANPEETANLVAQALTICKQRGILLTGWGGLQQSDLPDHIFKLEAAPHEWLFPRMAAVVHHGGAGTTAAGLRAGVPSVIVPFILDQHFWGKCVYDLGAGTRPIPRRRLTTERLAAAITRAVTDTAMQQRAADLGRKIRQEDGIANAIDAIHLAYSFNFTHSSPSRTPMSATPLEN